MRVRRSHDALAGIGREVALRISGYQPGRYAGAAQQHDRRRGELLAESTVRDEEEIVDGVLPRRRNRRKEVVDLVRMQIAVRACRIGVLQPAERLAR